MVAQCQQQNYSNRRERRIRDGFRGNWRKVSYGNVKHDKGNVEGGGNNEEDKGRHDGQMQDKEEVKG